MATLLAVTGLRPPVNRDRATAVAVAVLAVLAFGGAAATLDATTSPGGGLGGAGDDDAAGAGDGRFDLGGLNSSAPATGGIPPWVGRVVMGLLGVAALVALYVFYREHGLRELAKFAVGLVVLVGFVVLLAGWLPAFGDRGTNGTGLFGEGEISPPGGGPAGSGDTEGLATVDPPVVLLGLLGLVLLGAVVVVFRMTDDADRDPDPGPVDEPTPDVAAVGRAAGRAADRIAGDAEVTNEVYRAWREMTDHLDVDNPAAATPAEFADAAVAAGMAGEDVDELTTLFEDVRYGAAPPTADRERRALDALRRVEATYAEEAEP